MDEQITEQIEWLLSQNGNTGRLGRQLVTLVGFIADGTLPESIDKQMTSLSRQIQLKDIFDALISSLDIMTRNIAKTQSDKSGEAPSVAGFSALISQVEAARLDLAKCEHVNYAELISWIITQARERKILPTRQRRRYS